LYEHHEIVAVVTQPDEKKGTYLPVKKFALQYNLKLFQPEKVRDIAETLNAFEPDLYITAAFGQFIPSIILKHRPSINVHASLLPLYRGAAPIQYAIKDGLTKTGITIMYMEKEMDAGNIISSQEVIIEKEDNTSTLTLKLAVIGASLLLKTLPRFEKERPLGHAQDQRFVSFAPKWTPLDEVLHLEMNTDTFMNYVRANANYPGATLKTKSVTMKIYQAKKNDIIQPGPLGYINLSKHSLSISLKDGVIDILEIQIPGKKKLLIKDFLNGQKLFTENMIIKEI
ncbi:MAG: methionyl-tRNA formyltransferase, partial [Firmicutes bacterium]|nr:methionyl-tRNA formyltransferase [Bacillota bacterium]